MAPKKKKRGKRQKVQIFGKKRASSLLINRNESLATQGNQSMQQIRQLSLMLYSKQYLSYIVLQPRKLFQPAFTKTPLLDSKHARWIFLEFWSSRTILSVHANVTDAASTMVSTLSSGGGLTSLTTTFLSLKIHTRYPWHFFFFYVTLVS